MLKDLCNLCNQEGIEYKLKMSTKKILVNIQYIELRMSKFGIGAL